MNFPPFKKLTFYRDGITTATDNTHINETMNCYLYSSPSGIELIEGDKMPVKPEFKGDYFLHYGPQKQYEAAIQAAKASGIPVKDQEMAVSLIAHGQTILDIEKAKAHYCKPGEVYGPFNISYELMEACGNDSCAMDAGCEHCQKPVKVAILYDDTPATKGNLLPCPFCGSKPEWINEAIPDSHYYIKCPNCHIVMKEDRRDKVIGMWNNRFTITRK